MVGALAALALAMWFKADRIADDEGTVALFAAATTRRSQHDCGLGVNSVTWWRWSSVWPRLGELRLLRRLPDPLAGVGVLATTRIVTTTTESVCRYNANAKRHGRC
jgi:hypothetical protein